MLQTVVVFLNNAVIFDNQISENSEICRNSFFYV